MGVSRATRFKVFQRDNFTCRFCGLRAPDVILEVDHFTPKSRGGSDNEENLGTACFDCNRGKRDKLVNEPSGLTPYEELEIDRDVLLGHLELARLDVDYLTQLAKDLQRENKQLREDLEKARKRGR